ncbi:MAG: single-stranded DNA-binding protein [Dehalococcoidia bacterium]
MPYSVNRVELIGCLGHEPEQRHTTEGQAVTKFSLATDRPARSRAERETDWHQVVCWGRVAEFAGAYVGRARLVFVAGRLTYRTWEGRDGQQRRTTEIVATEFVPLGRRPDAGLRKAEDGEVPGSADDPDHDDDLPF